MPLRILEVTTLFPRWPGDGRGPIIHLTAQALQEQGAEVLVISMHGPGSKKHEVIDGVEVIRPDICFPPGRRSYKMLAGVCLLPGRVNAFPRAFPFFITHPDVRHSEVRQKM